MVLIYRDLVFLLIDEFEAECIEKIGAQYWTAFRHDNKIKGKY